MKSFLHWITDLLFPSRCIGCNALGADICEQCLHSLKPLKNQHGWIVATAPLSGIVEAAVYALKYRGMQQLAEPLGNWMAGAIGLRRDTAEMFGFNPLIVPVPLHPRRLRERGYNQAALLARRIAVIAAMPINEQALSRVRHTDSQVKTSSRMERLENMRGAFSANNPDVVRGHDIILIDDVCTTGATLTDCARALRAANASSIHAIVLARK